MEVQHLNELLQKPPIPPNFTAMFEFEKLREEDVSSYVPQYPFVISIVYVFAVFTIKAYMKDRKPFDLKWPLVAWNATLCLCSLTGFVRCGPELFHVLRTQGFAYSVCVPSFMNWDVIHFWGFFFIHLKIPELGDTIFIVLRKKKLTFLHWYHHATVLMFCFHAYQNRLGGSRYFIWMNYLAHIFMYAYYTLNAMKISPPLVLKMALTISQILQFFVGIYVLCYAHFLKRKGVTSCSFPDESIRLGLFLYFSYLILFMNFFYHTYYAQKTNKRKSN